MSLNELLEIMVIVNGKLIIEEINSVAKRKVISSALAILKKRGRNSKNGKSVIWIFVISMMMSS